MTLSIRSKLILSYLGIAFLTAGLIYGLIRYTSGARLKVLILEQQIAGLHDDVANWYEVEGTWDGFGAYFSQLHPLDERVRRPQPSRERPPVSGDLREAGSPPPPIGGAPQSGDALPTNRRLPLDRGPREGKHGVITSERLVLVPFQQFTFEDIVPEGYLSDAVAVQVNDETVAWIVPDDQTGISLAAEEQVYLSRTNQVLFVAGGISVAVALLTALGFARILIRPIRQLTQASRALANGEVAQVVDVHTEDELGELATTFNKMSNDLAEANRQRRQMTADIAHDLSTPLQVISGYIEAVQNGDLELTPTRINTIATEIEHLRRLIDDLDLLAQTDTRTLTLKLESVDTATFLKQVASSFTPMASAGDVELRAVMPAKSAAVYADRERLMQVIGNLVNNALRYTPAGGQIAIGVNEVADGVELKVQDTGSGIHKDDLPHIFDRFYRVDASRSDSGKMGLGLAISRGLVEAMGGRISAESEPNRGTTFSVMLPLAPQAA